MKKGIYAGLFFVVTIFIWHNSMQDAVHSGGLSRMIAAVLQARLLELGVYEPLGLVNGVLRKCAHVFEFSLLGIALYGLCSNVQTVRQHRVIWVIGIGVVIAAIDESLQLFSPGRGAQLRDVGIDGCGVLIGYLMGRIYSYVMRG